MSGFADLGMQAAGQAVDSVFGLALEGHNDRRQKRMHKELGQQQLALDRQKMGIQNDYALDLWNKTGYKAQVEQMKAAGLSPGLIYGMGGTGGATVGNQGGSVNGPAAPAGGGEIMGLQLMGAQRNLIQAETEKVKAEAAKIGGPDTGIATAEQTLRELQAKLHTETYWDSRNRIEAEAAKAISEANIADTQAEFQNETYQTRVGTIDAELIGLKLANELKREQKELTEAQTDAIIESVKQKWAEVEIKQGKLDLDKFVHDVADSTKLAVEMVSGITKSVLTKAPIKNINNTKTINSTRNFN